MIKNKIFTDPLMDNNPIMLDKFFRYLLCISSHSEGRACDSYDFSINLCVNNVKHFSFNI